MQPVCLRSPDSTPQVFQQFLGILEHLGLPVRQNWNAEDAGFFELDGGAHPDPLQSVDRTADKHLHHVGCQEKIRAAFALFLNIEAPGRGAGIQLSGCSSNRC